MLGFKALVAKSRELTTKLELSVPTGAPAAPSSSSAPATTSTVTSAPSPPPPTESNVVGHELLRLRQVQMDQALAQHHALVDSGDELATALAQTRARLLDEAESAQFLAQNAHLVSTVRQQLGHLRGLVLKIAEDTEDVENLLAQRSEEFMAQQNAEFAARQQEELERFEQQILVEKEGRRRALLEKQRQRLAQAFHDDLRTYQTLVTYQGVTAADAVAGRPTETDESAAVSAKETLESIDLVVEADAEQLDAFYDSDSASETEPAPRFLVPEPPRPETKPVVDTVDDVDPCAIPDDAAEEEEKEEEESAVTPNIEATEASGADATKEQQAAPSPVEATASETQAEEGVEAEEKAE